MRWILFVLIGGLLLGNIFLDSHIQNEGTEEVLVVYYFGSTHFGFCAMPENIEKIKKIRTDFSDRYKDMKIKFVMVCMDRDIRKGLKFIQKYGYWDEISIGQFYRNELALSTLSRSAIPEVPHILVFRDVLSVGKWNLPLIKERTLLVDLAGGEQISEWIQEALPIPFKNNPNKEK